MATGAASDPVESTLVATCILTLGSVGTGSWRWRATAAYLFIASFCQLRQVLGPRLHQEVQCTGDERERHVLYHVPLVRRHRHLPLLQVHLQHVDVEGVLPALPRQDDEYRLSAAIAQVHKLHGKVAGISFDAGHARVALCARHARLAGLHAPPGRHADAPVALIVFDEHPAPAQVILHHLRERERGRDRVNCFDVATYILSSRRSYRGGQAKVCLIAKLLEADQVRYYSHFAPAENLDG